MSYSLLGSLFFRPSSTQCLHCFKISLGGIHTKTVEITSLSYSSIKFDSYLTLESEFQTMHDRIDSKIHACLNGSNGVTAVNKMSFNFNKVIKRKH